MRYRKRILGMGIVALLFFAQAATAAVRWAEPGEGGANPACPQSDPCDLEEAVEGAVAGDEVVIQPGTYTETDPVTVSESDVVVHGQAGEPRPRLVTSGFTGFGVGNFSSSVRRLEIEHTSSGVGLAIFGTGEQLVVRSTAPTASAACDVSLGTLRDSSCSTTAGTVTAITMVESDSFARTFRLRNVTAVSAGSFGLGVRAQTGHDVTMDVKSSILRGGGGFDIRAETDGMASTSATVNLTHSNYATTSTGSGTTSVTAAGSGTNQVAMPIFVNAAAGDFRQASGSPTRNAGAVDADSGTVDFEGEPRSQESAPDIGADEFDTIPPSVAITSGPVEGETIGTREATFGFSSDDGLAEFTCAVDGGGFAACSGPGNSHALSGLADGPHTFSVRATDTGGLTATVTRSFSVSATPAPPPRDADPPETTITKTPPNRTEKESAKFKFRSDEPGSTFRCKRDKKPFKPCASPQRYRNLKEAKHRFQVQAIDPAGNVDGSPAKDTWKVLD